MDRRRSHKPPTRPFVLIVIDDKDTREMYEFGLSALGFEVKVVGDAAQAYTQAWEAHPDIILTDVSLTGIDGWKLVQDLKDDPRTRDIHVVVLTADAQASVRERALREGAALLIKPCLPQQLAMELRVLVNRNFSDEQT